MSDYCKFCGKKILTEHYVVYKGGPVCLGCKENVRKMLKEIVKKKGRRRKNEIRR